jgi:gamma-glutamylputrescine oxidase
MAAGSAGQIRIQPMAEPLPHLYPNIPAWDDEPWDGFPPAAGELEAEACVIGLGGSGLTAIGELLEMGRTVIGIDAATTGEGAAGRNGGFLLAGTAAFHHDSVATIGRQRAVALYALTMREIDRIANETPEAVRRTGSLRLAASAEEVEDCRLQLAGMQRDGLPAEWHERDGEEGLVIPTDCSFHPLRRCRELARREARRGAQIHERSRAVAVTPRLVRTEGATIRCERVIVATDGGLRGLVPSLSGRVRVARLQMLATSPLPELRWPAPVYSRYGFDYWQQLPDRRLLLGGCRDRCLEAEWTTESSPSGSIQALLDELLGRLGVSADVTHRWAASVSYTTDEMPILEEVDDGVWALGAYSGTGNVIGALCGAAAARAAFGEETEALRLLRSDG